MAEQKLPAGFTAATELPEKYRGFFGNPENLLGYKVTQYKDPATGKTFSRLSVSQKGAYGQAESGSSEFGAGFTEEGGALALYSPSNVPGANNQVGSDTPGTMTYTATDGKTFTNADAYVAYQGNLDSQKAQRQSAYNLLYNQFKEYGLEGLVTPLKDLIQSGVNPAEFTIKLRETDAYKKRFAANQARIGKGLRALSEAEYIGLEDQYQDVMKRYGLPASYYARGEMGRQEGFEKFIGGDVSAVELEDRIQTAQRRVINAAPQIKDALSQYYGNEISNGDILAYVLDPEKAIENIKRKVTAAEIGGAAAIAGLGAAKTRAEELGAFGITGEQARQGYQSIAEFLEPTRKLGDIYRRSGMGPYTQEIAEQEVFGISGAADAAKKRKQLAQLETAQFSGTSGITGGALGRERSGQF